VGTEPGAGLDAGEHIFHIATEPDWWAAVEAGDYRVSTLGRSLDDEGFIHASRRHQGRGVADAFYAGVTEPLVLLEIDPARLTCGLRLERPDGAAEAFPHLYGPLDLDAVVAVSPWSAPPWG
jgi:uncharacterized protein (DUF952 family)